MQVWRQPHWDLLWPVFVRFYYFIESWLCWSSTVLEWNSVNAVLANIEPGVNLNLMALLHWLQCCHSSSKPNLSARVLLKKYEIVKSTKWNIVADHSQKCDFFPLHKNSLAVLLFIHYYTLHMSWWPIMVGLFCEEWLLPYSFTVFNIHAFS